MNEQHPDQGYTLIEVLLVILVLGLLAAIVAIATGGITTESARTGCAADRRVLYTAVESYFMQFDTDVIPGALVALEDTADTYEQTLVTAKLLRSPSSFHDVAADGSVTVVLGTPCATPVADR